MRAMGQVPIGPELPTGRYPAGAISQPETMATTQNLTWSGMGIACCARLATFTGQQPWQR